MNNFLIQFDMLRVDRMLTEYEVKKLKTIEEFFKFSRSLQICCAIIKFSKTGVLKIESESGLKILFGQSFFTKRTHVALNCNSNKENSAILSNFEIFEINVGR